MADFRCDELSLQPSQSLEIHEIFSGNHNRKRCFYVRDCTYFVSRQSHITVHKNKEMSLLLFANRLKQKGEYYTQEALRIYFDELKRFVQTFELKSARYEWQVFFDNGCKGEMPLLKLDFEEALTCE